MRSAPIPKPSHSIALSSTHLRTALFPCPRTHALLHLFSFSILSSSCLSPTTDPCSIDPDIGPKPQSLHSRIAQPATPQISSHSTSNRTYQSVGSGIRRRRVASSIEAHANTCAGWIAYTGETSLKGVSERNIRGCRRLTGRLGLTRWSGLHQVRIRGPGSLGS